MAHKGMSNAFKFVIIGLLFVAFYVFLQIDYDATFSELAKPREIIDQKITAKEFTKSQNQFSVGVWNIQIFGQNKAANQTLMEKYIDVIDDHDIFIVQELRDVSGDVIGLLCANLSVQNYACINSSRAGRTSVKEQYVVFYKKDEFKLTESYDFNRQSIDLWERPPLRVRFERNGVEFLVYTIHTKPTDATVEMKYLESTVMRDMVGPKIVIGDLNADCGYHNQNNAKEAVFLNWYWVIKDTDDTTLSRTDCAYDRIVINKDMQKYYAKTYGITMEGITSSHSDHYPVWALFEI
jgi:deoxyribonuclease-1-like protein